MSERIVLSLCDFSGVWSQPYVDAGYRVVRIDLGYPEGEHKVADNVWHVGADLTAMKPRWKPYGVLAAPPCCCFCRPGARWWKRMDARGDTQKAVDVFEACLRVARTATGWWALENPPGRHKRLMEFEEPLWQWQPWHYGDPWSKQTYIWGTAKRPPQECFDPPPKLTYRTPNGHLQGRVSRMSSSWKRKREETPPGFARAFFKANQ